MPIQKKNSGTDLPNCLTMTIYATYPFDLASWTKINCVGADWSVYKAYREIPVTTARVSALSTLVIPTASESKRPATPNGTAISEPSQMSSSQSQVWIAGAVIGPVVAIVAAATFAFWLGKRQGRKVDSVKTPTMMTPSSFSPERPPLRHKGHDPTQSPSSGMASMGSDPEELCAIPIVHDPRTSATSARVSDAAAARTYSPGYGNPAVPEMPVPASGYSREGALAGYGNPLISASPSSPQGPERTDSLGINHQAAELGSPVEGVV